MKNEYTAGIRDVTLSDVALAGGKGTSLGEMMRAGISVPQGFIILATAFEHFLEESSLNFSIKTILHSVNHKNINSIDRASEK